MGRAAQRERVSPAARIARNHEQSIAILASATRRDQHETASKESCSRGNECLRRVGRRNGSHVAWMLRNRQNSDVKRKVAKRVSHRPARTSSARKSSRRSKVGRFSPDPDLSGYENLVGTCRACGVELIVNRATDLRGTYPSVNTTFECRHCGHMLRPSGDVANHPVDQFVYDAYKPMCERRYMQVVVLTAQSLELTLVMSVAHFILGGLRRPKRLRPTSPFARVAAKLDAALAGQTLGSLRAITQNLALAASPTSTAEAVDKIAALNKLRGKLPTAPELALIPEPALREAAERLAAIPNFVKLRNLVVHKAYRPTQQQAEWCMREIPKLTRALMRGFRIARGQLVMPPTAG